MSRKAKTFTKTFSKFLALLPLVALTACDYPVVPGAGTPPGQVNDTLDSGFNPPTPPPPIAGRPL